jgi:hypothetical protein
MDKFEQLLLKLYDLDGSHRVIDICENLKLNSKNGLIYTVLPRLVEMKILIPVKTDEKYARSFLINHNEIDSYFKNACFGFFRRIKDGKIGIE